MIEGGDIYYITPFNKQKDMVSIQILLSMFVRSFVLVSVACIAAVYDPSKRIKRMAITDTINEL